jgi:hypothetical protein
MTRHARKAEVTPGIAVDRYRYMDVILEIALDRFDGRYLIAQGQVEDIGACMGMQHDA